MTELRGAGGAFDAEIALMASAEATIERRTRLLSAAYVLQLRRSILDGAFNSESVADKVARSLLRSGDL